MSEATGEFENHEYPLSRAVVSTNSAIWPPVVDGSKRHELVQGVLKGRRSLPLFCNPVVLFLFNWMVMLTRASAVTPGELSAVWLFVRMGVAFSASGSWKNIKPLCNSRCLKLQTSSKVCRPEPRQLSMRSLVAWSSKNVASVAA